MATRKDATVGSRSGNVEGTDFGSAGFEPSRFDPTSRFGDRAGDYAEYRPGYPAAAFEFMKNELGLSTASKVADIGAGTGILAENFLKNGNSVWCVEPNAHMLAKANSHLKKYPGAIFFQGTAEATGLASNYYDFVCAGQAFHWFVIDETRREFKRILKPHGWVALLGNRREKSQAGFLSEYEELLHRYSSEYGRIHTNTTREKASRFFGGSEVYGTFANPLQWDFDHIAGYMFSASYTPKRGTPAGDEILVELRKIFDRYQRGEKLSFNFTTDLFCGKLSD